MFFSPVRLRAERKAGELDKRREKAQGRRTDLVPPGTQVDGPPTLRDLGISKLRRATGAEAGFGWRFLRKTRPT